MLNADTVAYAPDPREGVWPRPLRVALLIATIVSFALGVALLIVWVNYLLVVLITTGPEIIPWPDHFFLLHLTVFTVGALALVAYLVHVALNQRLSVGWQFGWAALLLVCGAAAQLIYWFRQVRR